MLTSPDTWGAEIDALDMVRDYGITDDPLAQINSDYRAMAGHVTLGKSAGDYAAATADLDADQRLFFAVLTYIRGVETDGHAGFFTSAQGVVWKDALDGLRYIGAQAHARVLMGASLRAGGEPALELDQRRKQIANLAPRFEDLDRQFSKSSVFSAVWRHFYAARFGQVAA